MRGRKAALLYGFQMLVIYTSNGCCTDPLSFNSHLAFTSVVASVKWVYGPPQRTLRNFVSNTTSNQKAYVRYRQQPRKWFSKTENEMFLQGGLAPYRLMMEDRRDLVDRVRYNADRAFVQDILKENQYLVDGNAGIRTPSYQVSLAFKAVPPKCTFMLCSTLQKS